MKLLCDNHAIVFTLKISEINSKGKHIKIHYHFIFNILWKEKLIVSNIPTSKMLADLLTKTSFVDPFFRNVLNMGHRRSSPM